MLDKYAIFSYHAQQRLKECQLSLAKANWLLYSATEEKLPKELKQRKPEKNDTAKYLRNGSLIFTLIPTSEKRTGDPVYIVVSVFEQKISGMI